MEPAHLALAAHSLDHRTTRKSRGKLVYRVEEVLRGAAVNKESREGAESCKRGGFSPLSCGSLSLAERLPVEEKIFLPAGW